MSLLLAGAITVAAVVLFVSGRLRIDLVSLLVLVTLGATRLVTPAEAVSGFANPATVSVLAMLILAGGLTRTGAISALGRSVGRLVGAGPARLLVVLMLTGAVLSSFINNTAVVAVLLPVAVKLARDRGLAPSRFLIPLSFACMFGGTNTLIGTSTNLLVSALAEQRGLGAFSVFEFTPLGLVFTAAGTLYMLVAGRFLLPSRRTGELTEQHGLAAYLAEVVVGQNSDLVGRPVAASGLEAHDVEVLTLRRDGRRLPATSYTLIEPGDLLIVRGPVKELLEVRQVQGLSLKSEAHIGDEDITSEELVLAEAVISPTSRLQGRTPRGVFFRQRYNVTILAIRRQEQELYQDLSRTPLAVGDTLLVQGRSAFVRELAQDPDFLLLGMLDVEIARRDKMWLAIGIMLAVPALAALGLVPIVVAALAGVAAMVLGGCLRMQEAYDAVDWSVIFLLAGVIPLGIALEHTGAARVVADQTLSAVGWMGPQAVLSVFYLLTSILTELMSNNATAILLTPIAEATASQLGVSARPFLFAIAFAASASFMTPLGYQTNALVYGPGGYRYGDYLRVGAPLNLLFWVLATALIPVFWPLR